MVTEKGARERERERRVTEKGNAQGKYFPNPLAWETSGADLMIYASIRA